MDPVITPSLSAYHTFELNPILYADPRGDKVRGTRAGMKLWYGQQADLGRRIGSLTGRTDLPALTLLNEYTTQLRTMQQMQRSTVLFKLATGPENDMAVNESKRTTKGRVDMTVRADGCASSSLAEQVTEGGLFLNGGWSFGSNSNSGADHLSARTGLITDVVDYRQMKTAGEAMSIDVNSSTFGQDVSDMQSYVNQLVQTAGPRLFRGEALNGQLNLSTPVTDGDLRYQGVDPTVSGQNPCTDWGCQVAGSNGRSPQEWRMQNGQFSWPSKAEMKEGKR